MLELSLRTNPWHVQPAVTYPLAVRHPAPTRNHQQVRDFLLRAAAARDPQGSSAAAALLSGVGGKGGGAHGGPVRATAVTLAMPAPLRQRALSDEGDALEEGLVGYAAGGGASASPFAATSTDTAASSSFAAGTVVAAAAAAAAASAAASVPVAQLQARGSIASNTLPDGAPSSFSTPPPPDRHGSDSPIDEKSPEQLAREYETVREERDAPLLACPLPPSAPLPLCPSAPLPL